MKNTRVFLNTETPPDGWKIGDVIVINIQVDRTAQILEVVKRAAPAVLRLPFVAIAPSLFSPGVLIERGGVVASLRPDGRPDRIRWFGTLDRGPANAAALDEVAQEAIDACALRKAARDRPCAPVPYDPARYFPRVKLGATTSEIQLVPRMPDRPDDAEWHTRAGNEPLLPPVAHLVFRSRPAAEQLSEILAMIARELPGEALPASPAKPSPLAAWLDLIMASHEDPEDAEAAIRADVAASDLPEADRAAAGRLCALLSGPRGQQAEQVRQSMPGPDGAPMGLLPIPRTVERDLFARPMLAGALFVVIGLAICFLLMR